MDGHTIKLVSNDDVSFDVPVEALHASTVLRVLIEVCVDNGEPIPIMRVDGDTLKKVIEYCVHHKDDPIVDEEEEKRRKYERERNRKCGEIMLMIDGVELVEEDMNPEEKRTDNLSEWDQQFVNVDQSMLISLIMASMYLDIHSLYDLICKAIAHLIKDKDPVELRKLFKITRKKFTPEDEEHFRFVDKWMLEAEKNEMIEQLKRDQKRGRKGRKWKPEKAAIKRVDKKILKLKKKGLYYKGKR
ncbi:hypothetical protein PRIPAC_94772 [Pristionchus pacificus]|nr:hypothetical protein PRIPAC_94772 [Pristionchus pacificus]